MTDLDSIDKSFEKAFAELAGVKAELMVGQTDILTPELLRLAFLHDDPYKPKPNLNPRP